MMREFEKEIAYFFGAQDERSIAASYLKALKRLEEIGSQNSLAFLRQELTPYLEDAYIGIARQKHLSFDTHQAALLELDIILGNANNASFEEIENLMVRLYTLVFQSHSPTIRKAAMLRTFLYRYKADILKREGTISSEDREGMVVIAQLSKKHLNKVLTNE